MRQTVTPSQFRSYMEQEGKSIIHAASQLDDNSISQSLMHLFECKGKIATIAVGKSALVAKKLCVTLNSIGVVSVFIHPTEAMHGDIGILRKEDVVVLISNSGETEEILRLLPVLQNNGAKRIGILGNLDSSLGRACHASFDASVLSEACPLNLLPTASTAVANAISDAICIAFSRSSQMTQADFAINHPAGALGKRLNIRLKDLRYHLSDSVKIVAETPWRDLIETMDKGLAGVVCVIDGENKLKGIVTDGDVRRNVRSLAHWDLERLRAQDVMTKNPIWVREDEYAYDALIVMENRNSEISIIPICDSTGEYRGIVRLHDILKTGLKI